MNTETTLWYFIAVTTAFAGIMACASGHGMFGVLLITLALLLVAVRVIADYDCPLTRKINEVLDGK